MDIFDILLEKFSKGMMRRNKSVGTTPNRGNTSDIIQGFYHSKNSYARGLNKNLNQLITGKIDKSDYIAAQRNLIDKHYKAAFLAGKRFAQTTDNKLTPDEIRSIGQQVGKEVGFMSNFADDVLNQNGRLSYKRRLKMYSDGLNAVFISGQMVYIPEDSTIHWVLGNTDKHCVDCLSYAFNSPYTKKNLPTVPKAGASQCLSNCRCHLKFPQSNQTDEYLDFVLENYTGNDQVPNEAQVGRLKQIRDAYYFNRGEYHINGDPDHMQRAKLEKQKYSQMITDSKLGIKKQLPIKDFLSEIDSFKDRVNFKRMTQINQDMTEIVSVHQDGKQFYGIVRGGVGDKAIIEDISERVLTIDISKTIIFRLV